MPTADECRPFINTKNIPKKVLPFETELHCIQAGYKKIIFETNSTRIPKDLDMILSQKNLNKLSVYRYENSHLDPMTIIYTPSAKKEALLLQKYLLEVEASKYFKVLALYAAGLTEGTIEDLSSAYALGKLLEYPEEDITLFYQRHMLIDHKMIPPKDYSNIKVIQNVADTSNDPRNTWQSELKQDRTKFNRWFELNTQLTPEQLEKQNNTLNAMIKELTQIPLKPQSVIQPSMPPQQKAPNTTKKTTSWWQQWKKPTAYATAALAAGAAAVYAYFAGTKKTSTVRAPHR